MINTGDLKAYRSRWVEVETILRQERRTASLETRWRQLNTAFAIARSLDLVREDPSEAEVFKRWASLKVKANL